MLKQTNVKHCLVLTLCNGQPLLNARCSVCASCLMRDVCWGGLRWLLWGGLGWLLGAAWLGLGQAREVHHCPCRDAPYSRRCIASARRCRGDSWYEHDPQCTTHACHENVMCSFPSHLYIISASHNFETGDLTAPHSATAQHPAP